MAIRLQSIGGLTIFLKNNGSFLKHCRYLNKVININSAVTSKKYMPIKNSSKHFYIVYRCYFILLIYIWSLTLFLPTALMSYHPSVDCVALHVHLGSNVVMDFFRINFLPRQFSSLDQQFLLPYSLLII